MLIKVKRSHEETSGRVSVCATEVSEIRKKVAKLNSEVKEKHLDLRTMPRLVEKWTIDQNLVPDLQEPVTDNVNRRSFMDELKTRLRS